MGKKKFEIGDRAEWKPEGRNCRASRELLERWRKSFGDGPFTVTRITNVSPDEQWSVKHSQVISLENLKGRKLRGYSAAWFRKIKD